MPFRVCLQCGELHRLGATCPQATAGSGWDGNRRRAAQAKFRRHVLKQAGNRCQAMVDGHRCTATTELQAHHMQPGNHDPQLGIALCRAHHKQADRYAR